MYKAKKGKICIVTDHADGESLLEKINQKFTSNQNAADPDVRPNSSPYFNEDQILGWFTQVCLALKSLHDQQLMH